MVALVESGRCLTMRRVLAGARRIAALRINFCLGIYRRRLIFVNIAAAEDIGHRQGNQNRQNDKRQYHHEGVYLFVIKQVHEK